MTSSLNYLALHSVRYKYQDGIKTFECISIFSIRLCVMSLYGLVDRQKTAKRNSRTQKKTPEKENKTMTGLSHYILNLHSAPDAPNVFERELMKKKWTEKTPTAQDDTTKKEGKRKIEKKELRHINWRINQKIKRIVWDQSDSDERIYTYIDMCKYNWSMTKFMLVPDISKWNVWIFRTDFPIWMHSFYCRCFVQILM